MTIDYELAKELKDAGFPQRLMLPAGVGPDPEYVREPTLSELIEACPQQFETRGVFTLASSNGGENWVASYNDFLSNKYWLHCLGNNPEEAVARLWLALNSNKSL